MSKPTVAILGASADRSKFGNKAVRAHLQQGYEVFPVNPNADEIEGLPAYKSLAEVPAQHLDRISVYLPPAVTLSVLPEIKAVSFDQLWLNPGTENDQVLAKANELKLHPLTACSIISLGITPSSLDRG